MKQGLELEINLFTRRVTNDTFSPINKSQNGVFLLIFVSLKILLSNCKAPIETRQIQLKNNYSLGIMFQTLYTFLFVHA